MPKTIRLIEAAKLLNVSRSTMKAIAETERMKKVRMRDGKTSPYYLLDAEVKAYQKERIGK